MWDRTKQMACNFCDFINFVCSMAVFFKPCAKEEPLNNLLSGGEGEGGQKFLGKFEVLCYI